MHRNIQRRHRLGLAGRALLTIAAGMAPLAGPGLLVGAGTPARAQGEPAADRAPGDLLADFIHFVKIARYDVAAGEGAALLDSGLSATEFVDLVDSSGELDRFQSAVARAMRVEAVQQVAAELDALYRKGHLERARDPEEIGRNIEMLGGAMGERLHARARLVAAGEYAMPRLLETLLGGADPAIRARVQQVMIELGRNAVGPLSEALGGLAPAEQEIVLNVLKSIPYQASLPAVVELFQTTDSDGVKAAAARVIAALGGDPSASPAALYAGLAEGYYAQRDELTNFPGEAFQLVWTFDATQGLLMTATPTAVYHETMAMRMAERSLKLDPGSQDTLALWIASAFRREIDGAGLEHLEPAAGRDAMYYAVAAGPSISQRILARAIDGRDTPLARQAIAAIERTAGVGSLTSDDLGRRPMIEALGFHSRRVQIEAALAVALSQPVTTFEGSGRVVPILASAIRNADERFAVVLSGTDREEYDRLRTILEKNGYEVLPPADNGIDDILGPISEAPGIDLIVTSLPGAATVAAYERARTEPRLAAAPIMILGRSADMLDLQRRFDRDRTVLVRRDVITNDQMVAAIGTLVDQAIGGVIDEAEARGYATRCLGALRDLAIAQNIVLRVDDAALPLIAALDEASGPVQSDIAEVLSHVDQARAQVALCDAALDAVGQTRIGLLGKVADSAKRFGNLLENRQVARVLKLAGDSDLDTATAAAAVAGTLDLPNTDLVPLITGSAPAGLGNRAAR
ncbi:MAG: hypothetical protein H6810_11665 [Phycisphaeraceae bacterium]|nr:MAG: hypothetical protein H6810_11665 [Phycisphaeraceae bacterium]